MEQCRRSFGGEPNVHPEGKQFHLATVKPHPITATIPTTRIPSTTIPTPVPKRGESVNLPTFPKPFSFLFSKKPHFRQHRHNLPSSNKGILPLPPYSPFPAQETGWTAVVNRKRQRHDFRAFSHPHIPTPHKYFFCHKLSHMAKDCPEGDFICFLCHGKGHTSKDCPYGPRSNAPPPVLAIPSKTMQVIEDRSSFAIFYLAIGQPSISKLREMLACHFNLPAWPHQIKQAAGTSFMVQFPSDDLLD